MCWAGWGLLDAKEERGGGERDDERPPPLGIIDVINIIGGWDQRGFIFIVSECDGWMGVIILG